MLRRSWLQMQHGGHASRRSPRHCSAGRGALGGFAGVVVVFRAESVHQRSRIDRFRLQLLLASSVSPLVYSLFAILLVTIPPPPESIWRWCSAFAVLFQVPLLIINSKMTRSLTCAEFKGVNKSCFSL